MSVPMWFRRELRYGDYGSDVDTVRRKLLLEPGVFDETLSRIVKGLALRNGVTFEGSLNARLAELIGESEANVAGLLPQWYEEQKPEKLRELLSLQEGDDLIPAIKRWQGSHGFIPTGVITEQQARLIGD